VNPDIVALVEVSVFLPFLIIEVRNLELVDPGGFAIYFLQDVT
jgi:hypothetical protein